MRFVLWGTGVYGQRILAAMDRLEADLPGFREGVFSLTGVVDRAASRQGSLFGSFRVEAPERIRCLPAETAILIAMREPVSVLSELRQWGISAERIFSMQRFFRFFFCEAASAAAEWQARSGHLPDASEQLLAWLRAAGELVRSGAFSENYIREVRLPRADMAGIFDLALSDEEIRHFYQENSYGGARAIRTLAVHYLRFHNGGVERVIAEQLPVLRALGLRVVLLLDEYDEGKSYPCPSDVPIVVLGRKDDGWLGWYRRFQAACKQYDVDAVYCHRYLADVPFLPWLVRSEGRHFFAELHNVFAWWVQSRYTLLRVLCRQAEKVAVLSRVDACFWRLQGVRAVFLPNPIALPERKQMQGSERKDIYWIGRLEQVQKKVYDVVDIMKQVLSKEADVKLHLVGTTDHSVVLEELKRKIANAGIASYVIFDGYQADLREIYRRAHVCLMTSCFEGFPMVLTEALGQGLPVVMYDLPYLELVRQCRGIFRVPMGDTEAAAEALIILLEDDALWQRASTAAADSLRSFVQRYHQGEILRAFLFQEEAIGENDWDEETLRILVDTLVDWQIHPRGGVV